MEHKEGVEGSKEEAKRRMIDSIKRGCGRGGAGGAGSRGQDRQAGSPRFPTGMCTGRLFIGTCRCIWLVIQIEPIDGNE